MELVITGGCVIVLFVLIICVCSKLYDEQSKNEVLQKKLIPYDSKWNISHIHPTISITLDILEIKCISLPRNVNRFYNINKKLSAFGLRAKLSLGIDGKRVDMWDPSLNLSPTYTQWLSNIYTEYLEGKRNNDMRGHLGATLAHINTWKSITRPTLIIEDDVEFSVHFDSDLTRILGAMDKHNPDWEILVLGYNCKYSDYPDCKLNDNHEIRSGGVCKLSYFVGGYGYIVRDYITSQKMLKLFNPITNNVDIQLAEELKENRLNIWGAMPNIVIHPCDFRISTYDTWFKGDCKNHKSDTHS
jgi:GR25 family glycosyltransferase involved in LPS biosynthesis